MSEIDLPPSETPQQELKGTLNNWGKIQLADHLRLMADNQQALDQANRADARSRDLASRAEEARAKAAVSKLADAPVPAEEEEVNIYIDSPVSINSPPQVPTKEAASSATGGAGAEAAPAAEEKVDTPLWKKAATLAAIVAGTGSLPLAGVGLHSMFSGPAASVVTPPAVERPAEPAEPVQVPVQTPVPPSFSVKVNKRAAVTP